MAQPRPICCSPAAPHRRPGGGAAQVRPPESCRSEAPGVRRRPASREAGFTLIELLVVLVILGVLMTVAAPQAMRYLGSAKHDGAKLQLQAISTAIDLYRLDVGRYPSRDEGLAALVQKPTGSSRWNGPYVRKAEQLQDPWNRLWRYRVPGEHGPYDLYSLGADDRSGGADEDRDVTSW